MTHNPPDSKVISAAQAAALIDNEQAVFFSGSGGGHLVPESIIEALSQRYHETGTPSNLTLCSVVSIGDWESKGFSRLAAPGLARRVISAGFNNCPAFAELALAEKIEAYTLPQGVLSQLTRDMAAGRPGLITTIGLGTFVDPRLGGGKQNKITSEDLVAPIEVNGEEFLFYKSLPIDVAIIRGTTADEAGNISLENEPIFGEILPLAMAARRRGGTVICQVNRLAQAGSIPSKQVKVPGVLVDHIVVSPDQPQTYQTAFNAGYAGLLRVADPTIEKTHLDARKVIARRAAMELFSGAIVNLGYGVSIGITPVAKEEGFLRDICLTVEQGLFGGAPALGKDFGTGVNYDAMVDQPYQFDFYDGGGLDIAFLSFAQVDGRGNVNVSRYGTHITGPGGFINIAQNTPRVVFSGTLTTGGLRITPDNQEGMILQREGRTKKFVSAVEQVTFSGERAVREGQDILFVTERAVFRLRPEGIVLTEIATGVDLERDVLSQVEFDVRVAENLKKMDPRLFSERPMGLKQEFERRVRRS